VGQVVKKFLAFCEIQTFISVFTACYLPFSYLIVAVIFKSECTVQLPLSVMTRHVSFMLTYNCKFASETEEKSENTVAFEKSGLGLK